MKIDLPLLDLRGYQQEIWDRWFTEGIRKMSLEWHRRAGKDLFSFNIMIAEALRDLGNYWHVLPEAQQIRSAIWEGVTKDGVRYLDYIPEQFIHHMDKQSMKVYLRNPAKLEEIGSIISFVGGDRYDKRVGAGLKGAVISEHSLQKPNIFDIAIEPMLKETGGWCIFNYTPRGENHATKMWDFLDSHPEKYIASSLTIIDTGIVKEEDLQEERERGKPEEIIQQEYYVSREGAIFGSYYGDVLKNNKDKVGNYPYDPQYPVHTLWDLGVSDAMAIWFIQFIQREIHIIDYYENTNFGLGHYASTLQGKGYMYAMHHLPHDGRKREMTSGEKATTVESQLRNLGIHPIKIHEARRDIYGTIQMVRATLPRCYFNDTPEVMQGHEALKQYQREWDENRQIFKTTPLHNWACLPAGTLIKTPSGGKPVEDFRPGDGVQVLGKTLRVTRAQEVGVKNITCIRTPNHDILMSEDHKVFTSRGIVRARDIVPGDLLVKERRAREWLASKKGILEAFTESFKESNIGTGKRESYMPAKRVASSGSCTEYSGSITTGLFLRNMLLFPLVVIGIIFQLITGIVVHMLTMGRCLNRNIHSLSLMALGFMRSTGDIMPIRAKVKRRICTGMFGSSLTERYQRAMQYIILTLTKAITKLRTFGYCLLQSTQGYTVVLGVEKLPKQTTYDIEVEHHHAYVLYESGVVTSNSHGADAFSLITTTESTQQKRRPVQSKQWNGRFR